MLSRVANVLQREGLRGLLRRTARAIWRQRAFELYGLDCRSAQLPEDKLGTLRFEILTEANLGALSALLDQALAANPETQDYFDDIRKGRVVGVLAHDRGRLVHYSFLFKRNKTACLLGLPRTAALVGNAFTFPDSRGLGVQGASLRVRASVAAQEGFLSIVAETAPENLASQRGMARGGMVHIGRLNLVVVLNCLVIRWRRPEKFRLCGVCFG